MTREVLIKKTIENLSKLSDQKLKEVSDFTEFLISKIEDRLIVDGIKNLAAESKSYDFLKGDEDLYTVNDLKEEYK